MAIFSAIELPLIFSKPGKILKSEETLALAIEDILPWKIRDDDEVNINGITFDKIESINIDIPNNATTSPTASGSVVTEHLNKGLITINIKAQLYKIVQKVSTLNKSSSIVSNRLGSLGVFEDEYTAQAQSLVNEATLKATEIINYVDSKLSVATAFYQDILKFTGTSQNKKHIEKVKAMQGMRMNLFEKIVVRGVEFDFKFILTNMSIVFNDIINDIVDVEMSLQEYRTVEVVEGVKLISPQKTDAKVVKSLQEAKKKTTQGQTKPPSTFHKTIFRR